MARTRDSRISGSSMFTQVEVGHEVLALGAFQDITEMNRQKQEAHHHSSIQMPAFALPVREAVSGVVKQL